MAKSISKSFKKHLSEYLSDYFEPDVFFVIGVSGGPDSMALLYLFHQLNVDALVVHVNYGKRGKQSDQDQELVEQMAFSWGFECCSVQLDPKEAKGKNFQDWARQQRYQFFGDLKNDIKADAIVTAHHQDDQIETILQKIFRGSSPAAWQGMEIWDGKLFRPLLPFSKEQILDLCKSEAVPYRIDKSNETSDFARNFIRNEFSKKMDDLFPGWKKNILDLPEQGETFEASIHMIVDQVAENNTIELKKFSKLPEVLKPAVLKTFLDQSGLKGEYSKGKLKELAEIESLQTGKSLRIGNIHLTRDRDHIHLHPEKETAEFLKTIDRDKAQKGLKLNGSYIELKSEPYPLPALRLDASKLDWPLQVRSWSSGDELNPLGMNGTQKISDHLTNRKIPTTSREKTLVLCGSDGTIYAIIYPSLSANGEHGAISEAAKCESTTKTFLTINFT
ncbi:MAG TPA: tRNA lysidine(34) synthetase TilS [Gracilimonas sp.]|uniref:tRNA lysidine(34) synthetase TilS n=1 Tax=Gracilimonas sp. TaxID=1974203 RepID=UPI002D89BFE1|nr:tRNA lysidine(34) synthetase TilS [Gracilimonas sp.]